MTPNEKYIARRLEEILEVAKKNQQEHKEWVEDRKKRREERIKGALRDN